MLPRLLNSIEGPAHRTIAYCVIVKIKTCRVQSNTDSHEDLAIQVGQTAIWLSLSWGPPHANFVTATIMLQHGRSLILWYPINHDLRGGSRESGFGIDPASLYKLFNETGHSIKGEFSRDP